MIQPKQYKLHLLNDAARLDLIKDGVKLSNDIKIQYLDCNESFRRQPVTERYGDVSVESYVAAIEDAINNDTFTFFGFIQRPGLVHISQADEYYDLGHRGPLPLLDPDKDIDFFLFIYLIPDAAELLVKRHDLELWD